MKINCINSSFPTHLHYIWTAATSPGDRSGMKYQNPSDKVKWVQMQAGNTNNTLHSGSTLSGTHWESASMGLRKKNLEKFDLGPSQENPKWMPHLQLLVSHQH